MSTDGTDFARERQLIEKLELRIAGAATADKLQDILSKFLAPLLLKLASTDVGNRNLTIKICQYINQRLKIDETIQLPIEALSKVFKDAASPFVKQFSRMFLQQGIVRLSQSEAYAVLPTVMQSSFGQDESDPSDTAMWAIGYDLLLRVLRDQKFPDAGTAAETHMVSSFELSVYQVRRIARCLSAFLLYDPKDVTHSTLPTELQEICGQRFPERRSIVPNIAYFIQSPLFDTDTKFVPALILLVDANEAAAGRADVIFKQNDFDLESQELVQAAFDLYQNARPRLKTQILTLLTKSKLSTTYADIILSIVGSQLQTAAVDQEAAKLRTAMFSYLFWTIRCNPGLGHVAQAMLTHLKEFVEMQGWPVPNSLSPTDIELRAKAYESIGLLATSIDMDHRASEDAMDLDAGSDQFTALVSWLFTSLRCDTTRDIRHSIEQALSRLMSKETGHDTAESHRLKALLQWNVLAQEGDLDPIYHVPTIASAQYVALRFVNAITSYADVDARILDIVALGSKKREIIEEGQRGLDPTWRAKSSLSDDTSRQLPRFGDFLDRLSSLASDSLEIEAALLVTNSLSGLVAFLRNLLAVHAWREGLFAFGENDEWTTQVDQTLDHDREARALFKSQLRSESPTHVVRLLLYAYRGFMQGSAQCGRMGLQITSLATDGVLAQLPSDIAQQLRMSSASITNKQTACRLMAILTSASSEWQETVKHTLQASEGWETAVGHESAKMEIDLLYAAYTTSRAALRRDGPANTSLLDDLATRCKLIIAKTSDRSLKDTAYHAIGQLSLCLPLGTWNISDLPAITSVLLKDAKKENEVAISTMGRLLSLAWASLDGATATEYLQRIVELHEIKKAEFHFALGEALTTAALRFQSSSTLGEFDVDADIPDDNNHPDLYRRLMETVIEKSKTTKPAMRKATGIWLLSLVQYCEDENLTRPYLRECQGVFSRLLTDRNEIVQETGSRGLGIVYEKGEADLREDLVRELVQSFTGNSAKTSGTVTEDTQLFEAGALPTEDGQSITTYKDIVSLAQEMGDPSLVYRFMNLASNNAIWSSRAAFGRFGLSGVLADSSYLQDNKKFYPKLFRYRFDPNPNVQRSMNEIWKALVKDPQAVIDTHFDLIMQDLLKSILSGREWRAREASCAAISDLVQGRDVEKFEKFLDEIWQVAFKVLDDIKESVRLAAMKMCRTLTSMLVRNLEVGEGTGRRAVTMLNHAIPFLLQQMEGTSGQDVQRYAIVTLLEIVKKAPPRTIESFAPTILEKMINSLSSLEHEGINYLHLNADKYGLTAEKLDNMRVSSIGTSPVSEAIEKCLDSLAQAASRADGTASFEDALNRLERSFKVAIGLPSRVGLSRAVITLVVRHHSVFRPYADRFARLCRRSILDRNVTISQSFTTALAYTLRLVSDKEIRHTSTYAEKLYFESQEIAHRAVAGEILQAISKASNDVFSNFAALFLPFTFVGREDTERDVRNRFEVAWKDNVGGSRAARLYLAETVALIQKHITSSLWPIRHACCFAVASLVTMIQADGPYTLPEAETLWPLMEESLNGKTWDGKERVAEAWPKFVQASKALWPERTQQMVKISMREAKRTNAAYRPHALNALAEFARVRMDVDMMGEVVPYVAEVVAGAVQNVDAMDLDHAKESVPKESSESLRVQLLSSAITCLFANSRATAPTAILERALEIIQRVDGEISDDVQRSIYREATTSLESTDTLKAQKAVSWTSRSDEVSMEKSATNDEAALAGFKIFWSGLAMLLFGPDKCATYGSGTERLRQQKVELATKLSASTLVTLDARETLTKTLSSWLVEERSQKLRADLDKAVRGLSK